MHARADDNQLQLCGLLYGYECLHVPAAAARRVLQQRRTVTDWEVFWPAPFEIPNVVAPGPVARSVVAVLQRLFDAN